MDKWASGKYGDDVAFVCVSLAGPELASTFVKELDELLGGGVALRQLTGTFAAILNAPHASHALTS